jgi:hypothetical protein
MRGHFGVDGADHRDGEKADKEGSAESNGAAGRDRQVDGDDYGYGKGHD